MFQSYRTKFKGVLNNTSVSELNVLDFDKTTIRERKSFLKEKHDRIGGFYEAYIFTKEENIDGGSICPTYTNEELSQYYKYNLNTNDELSEAINIFQTLERDGSYLLNSRDAERSKQQKYTILDKEEFEKILKREQSLESLCGNEDDSMSILREGKKNLYTNLEHKIKEEDLTHYRCGQVLRDYDKARKYLKTQMEKMKNGEEADMNLYKARQMLKSINDNMILAKNQLRGVKNPAKRLGDESGMFYSEMLDYTDPKHIKAILKNIKFGELEPNSDLSHIALDMKLCIEQLFNKGCIDEIDMEIVECYNVGYSLQAIGEEVGMKKQSVDERLRKIFKKISKFYLTKQQKKHYI